MPYLSPSKLLILLARPNSCSSGFGLCRGGDVAIQRLGRGVAGRRGGRAPIPGETLARMRRHGQPARPPQFRLQSQSPPSPNFAQHEYGFLLGKLVDRATLERAEAEAAQCGVTTHEVLLASVGDR